MVRAEVLGANPLAANRLLRHRDQSRKRPSLSAGSTRVGISWNGRSSVTPDRKKAVAAGAPKAWDGAVGSLVHRVSIPSTAVLMHRYASAC